MNIQDLTSARPSRRQVVTASLTAVAAAMISPLKKFVRPARKASQSLMAFDAGKPESYELHNVDARFRDSQGIWIVRHLDSLYALSVKTSEGQLTEWNKPGQYFSTSAGQRYYKSGICYQGSKRKSLKRVAVTLNNQGHLELDPAKTFRQERGEWAHPQSFLNLKGTNYKGAAVPLMPTKGTVPITAGIVPGYPVMR